MHPKISVSYYSAFGFSVYGVIKTTSIYSESYNKQQTSLSLLFKLNNAVVKTAQRLGRWWGCCFLPYGIPGRCIQFYE